MSHAAFVIALTLVVAATSGRAAESESPQAAFVFWNASWLTTGLGAPVASVVSARDDKSGSLRIEKTLASLPEVEAYLQANRERFAPTAYDLHLKFSRHPGYIDRSLFEEVSRANEASLHSANARIAADEMDWSRAIRRWELSLAACESASAHGNLAWLYRMESKPQLELEHARKAVAWDQGFRTAYYFLGEDHRRRDEAREAIENYALFLEGGSESVHFRAILIQMLITAEDEDVRDWKRGARLFHEWFDGRVPWECRQTELLVLAAEGKFNRAFSLQKELVKRREKSNAERVRDTRERVLAHFKVYSVPKMPVSRLPLR